MRALLERAIKLGHEEALNGNCIDYLSRENLSILVKAAEEHLAQLRALDRRDEILGTHADCITDRLNRL